MYIEVYIMVTVFDNCPGARGSILGLFKPDSKNGT